MSGGKGRGPDVWHAQVLREEAEHLTIAVRILEFADGYREGQGIPLQVSLDTPRVDAPAPAWMFSGAVQ